MSHLWLTLSNCECICNFVCRSLNIKILQINDSFIRKLMTQHNYLSKEIKWKITTRLRAGVSLSTGLGREVGSDFDPYCPVCLYSIRQRAPLSYTFPRSYLLFRNVYVNPRVQRSFLEVESLIFQTVQSVRLKPFLATVK